MTRDVLEIHQSDPVGCLASLKAKVIDRLDVPNDAAKVGTLVHKVAERLVVEKLAAPMVDVFEVAREVVRTEARTLGLSPAGIVDALGILERVLSPGSRINLWPEMGWKGAAEWRWGLTEHDEEFGIIENPKATCYAAGTVDLIEWMPDETGICRITDWKTSMQMFGAEEAWQSWQARLYAYAALRRFPQVRHVEFRYGMLRHGYYSTPVDFLRGDPWEWGVETRLRATREQRERAVASGEWPETPGPWCHYCPVRWSCDAFLRVCEIGAEVPADWDPQTVATTLAVAKTQVRDLDRRARAIVEESGRPIPLDPVSGLVLGHKETNGVEAVLDYDATMNALRMYGMTRSQEAEHFRFCASNHYPARVRKVLREVLGVSKDEVENVVTPVTRTEFTTFVPDPEERRASLTDEELDELIDNIGV